MLAQLPPLLPRGFLQGAGRQAASSGLSHFFHLREIDIQAGALLAESLPHHNFPPLFGQARDRLQFLGRQPPCCHDIAVLEVSEIRRSEFPPPHPRTLHQLRKGGPALSCDC